MSQIVGPLVSEVGVSYEERRVVGWVKFLQGLDERIDVPVVALFRKLVVLKGPRVQYLRIEDPPYLRGDHGL